MLIPLRREGVTKEEPSSFFQKLRMTGLLLLASVFLASCSMEDCIRHDEPLTRENAEKELSQKFPTSASAIYSLLYAGGLQDLESYVRFHVDPAQADQAIEDLIVENNRVHQRASTYARTPLPPPQPAGPMVDSEGRFKPITWWEPQTIKHGYFREERQSYGLKIWYDADQSIVYVYQND